MKKILAFLVLAFICNYNLYAQKIYSTKTGKITFFSSAPLEDIEAKNNEVESKLAAANGQLVFILLMKGFEFENELMQDHFNEDYAESTKFPKADFKGSITNISEINFAKDGTYSAKVKGNLTMHGVTKEIQSNGTIEVKNQKIAAKAKFPISLKDFNIGGSLIGKKIANNIDITVNCQYE